MEHTSDGNEGPRILALNVPALVAEVLAGSGSGEVRTAPPDLDRAAAVARSMRPDFVLVDAGRVDDSAEAVRRLKRASPGTKVAVITDAEDPRALHRLLAAGVDAVLPAESLSGPLLAAAVAFVLAQPMIVAPAALRDATAPRLRELVGDGAASDQTLSDDERTLLRAMAIDDLTEAQAARALGMKERTAARHLHEAKRKLGIETLVALGWRAQARGLLTPDAPAEDTIAV